MHISFNQCYLQYGKICYMVPGVKVSARQTEVLHKNSQKIGILK